LDRLIAPRRVASQRGNTDNSLLRREPNHSVGGHEHQSKRCDGGCCKRGSIGENDRPNRAVPALSPQAVFNDRDGLPSRGTDHNLRSGSPRIRAVAGSRRGLAPSRGAIAQCKLRHRLRIQIRVFALACNQVTIHPFKYLLAHFRQLLVRAVEQLNQAVLFASIGAIQR